jgi:hypothetical protein
LWYEGETKNKPLNIYFKKKAIAQFAQVKIAFEKQKAAMPCLYAYMYIYLEREREIDDDGNIEFEQNIAKAKLMLLYFLLFFLLLLLNFVFAQKKWLKKRRTVKYSMSSQKTMTTCSVQLSVNKNKSKQKLGNL